SKSQQCSRFSRFLTSITPFATQSARTGPIAVPRGQPTSRRTPQAPMNRSILIMYTNTLCQSSLVGHHGLLGCWRKRVELAAGEAGADEHAFVLGERVGVAAGGGGEHDQGEASRGRRGDAVGFGDEVERQAPATGCQGRVGPGRELVA